MLNKAFILVVMMVTFFCLKEVSTYYNLCSNIICLAEDLNEESQDNSDTDSCTEGDLKCSDLNSFSINFHISTYILNTFPTLQIAGIINPFYEIHCPPPQNF